MSTHEISLLRAAYSGDTFFAAAAKRFRSDSANILLHIIAAVAVPVLPRLDTSAHQFRTVFGVISPEPRSERTPSLFSHWASALCASGVGNRFSQRYVTVAALSPLVHYEHRLTWSGLSSE